MLVAFSQLCTRTDGQKNILLKIQKFWLRKNLQMGEFRQLQLHGLNCVVWRGVAVEARPGGIQAGSGGCRQDWLGPDLRYAHCGNLCEKLLRDGLG